MSEVGPVHDSKTHHSNFCDSHTVQDTMMRSGKLWRADLSIEPATSKASGKTRVSQCSRRTLKDYFEALCLSVAERTGSVRTEGFPEAATPLERFVIHDRILEESARVLLCLNQNLAENSLQIKGEKVVEYARSVWSCMSLQDQQDLAKLNPPNLGELLHTQESQLLYLRTTDRMLAYVIKGIHLKMSSLKEDSPSFKAAQKLINKWIYAILWADHMAYQKDPMEELRNVLDATGLISRGDAQSPVHQQIDNGGI